MDALLAVKGKFPKTFTFFPRKWADILKKTTSHNNNLSFDDESRNFTIIFFTAS